MTINDIKNFLEKLLRLPQGHWSAWRCCSSPASSSGALQPAMELTNQRPSAFPLAGTRRVYVEYRDTVHLRTARACARPVRIATCRKRWSYKIVRKIQASSELLPSAGFDRHAREIQRQAAAAGAERMGADEEDRLARMRNCHNFESFDYAEQNRRSRKRTRPA